jgi:hypothetical protein
MTLVVMEMQYSTHNAFNEKTLVSADGPKFKKNESFNR